MSFFRHTYVATVAVLLYYDHRYVKGCVQKFACDDRKPRFELCLTPARAAKHMKPPAFKIQVQHLTVLFVHSQPNTTSVLLLYLLNSLYNTRWVERLKTFFNSVLM